MSIAATAATPHTMDSRKRRRIDDDEDDDDSEASNDVDRSIIDVDEDDDDIEDEDDDHDGDYDEDEDDDDEASNDVAKGRKTKKDRARERCVVEQEFVRCLVYIDELNIERDSRREEKSPKRG